MKISESSKNIAIRHQSELIRYFRELLVEDPDLQWHFPPTNAANSSKRIELEFDGRLFPFVPIYELKPSLPWLEIQKSTREAPPLLVAPSLSPRVLGYCKQHGIAAMDLNGRTWLRASGLLVDRRPLPGRSFSYELEPRNIFVGKSARIIRCLLTDRERLWTQSEIVPRARASSGLVSRIVHHLISQGFAEKTGSREFRLRAPLELLDAWTESDRFVQRTLTKSYAGFLGDPWELARRIQDWAKKEAVSIAFTQWIAAWVRHPFSEPVLTSAYVSHLPEAAALENLGLREVSEGGKLWLHVPDDDGLFLETQIRQELPLTTDAQIYLDLQHFGLRGPDAADALREWDGFCKP